jgi:hypothetical protein
MGFLICSKMLFFKMPGHTYPDRSKIERLSGEDTKPGDCYEELSIRNLKSLNAFCPASL